MPVHHTRSRSHWNVRSAPPCAPLAESCASPSSHVRSRPSFGTTSWPEAALPSCRYSSSPSFLSFAALSSAAGLAHSA